MVADEKPDQFDPTSRYLVVEYVIRKGWDGPGRIRCMKPGMTLDEALALAAELEPEGTDCVAVRAWDTHAGTWAGTDKPAWNPAVHNDRE